MTLFSIPLIDNKPGSVKSHAMNKNLLSILSLIALTFAARAQDKTIEQRLTDLETKLNATETATGSDFRGYWKNGFIFEQPDKAFRLQIGARFQLDTAFFSADDDLEADAGPFDDGVKFRRAYLYTRGNLYDNLSYLMEYNFASGVGFQNFYMAAHDIPVVGNMLVGQTLEPMGLEENSSNNSITFMERGATTAFNPIYNTGIMAWDNLINQRARWALGVFKETDDLGASQSNEGFAVTARLTGLPYLSADEKQYLHLGGSMSVRDTSDSGYRLRARPGSYIAPYVVDTARIDADSVNLAALEAAAMIGPVFLQSEWSMAGVDVNPSETYTSDDDAEFTAYYIMASYFLTGEYRPYSKSGGTIGRVTPAQNATGKNWGRGAWEIGARYDAIELNDNEIAGGEMDGVTLGLNWYLNPHTRIMWDYVMADVKDVGDVDTFQMRFQFDF